jgi:hypothetical protein
VKRSKRKERNKKGLTSGTTHRVSFGCGFFNKGSLELPLLALSVGTKTRTNHAWEPSAGQQKTLPWDGRVPGTGSQVFMLPGRRLLPESLWGP